MGKSRTERLSVQEQVSEFHEAFGVSEDSTDNKDLMWLRMRLVNEEFHELMDAAGFMEDPAFGLVETKIPVDRELLLDSLADLVYVAVGWAISHGWDFDEAFRRVHESNMTKLGPDGKPIYRPDGKILKGPEFQPPDLKDLVK